MRNGAGAIVLLLVLQCLAACQGTLYRQEPAELTAQRARQLAAELANEKCLEVFAKAPFDMSTYAIEFRNGRWLWGRMDPAGVEGYSAVVSFDGQGRDRQVEVFFSTDIVGPDERPQPDP